MALQHFTEPTTYYWQEIVEQDSSMPPWQYSYPALLPDNRVLYLPIRPLPSPDSASRPNLAIASLFLTQASFSVVDALGSSLASLIRSSFGTPIDAIVGLPTLGLGIASLVAKDLGHSRFVALGYSRKFWYTDDLSATLSSITSHGEKKVYLDPAQLPLIQGKNVLVVDDAVSTGKTVNAVWDFLESENVGANVVGVGVAMKQGSKWRDALGDGRRGKIEGVFECPLLKAVAGGWVTRD
ncbi:phosphoribosyl transferase domain-containing protein [Amylocarpus encephaloides]|uniref:Phosphoribosyl transferase domain-containing protein n=1 Tax=Amylocarpus encephaloides TaxID=45428 RepID=A0A9P8C5P2_9HELO|nr:phosphoribosyl transferase domain-containing protein [Amylocarpus encephaloides]